MHMNSFRVPLLIGLVSLIGFGLSPQLGCGTDSGAREEAAPTAGSPGFEAGRRREHRCEDRRGGRCGPAAAQGTKDHRARRIDARHLAEAVRAAAPRQANQANQARALAAAPQAADGYLSRGRGRSRQAADPPSGDKHDYMSQAPYYWPADATNPPPDARYTGDCIKGNYVNHDGIPKHERSRPTGAHRFAQACIPRSMDLPSRARVVHRATLVTPCRRSSLLVTGSWIGPRR